MTGMKRAGFVVGAVLLLALTGCSASAGDAPAESTAPLAAEAPATNSGGSDEAAFLAAVRENLPANTQIPDATDEQLLSAGADACAALDAGTPGDQISVIDGETKNGADLFGDSAAIVTTARQTICPA